MGRWLAGWQCKVLATCLPPLLFGGMLHPRPLTPLPLLLICPAPCPGPPSPPVAAVSTGQADSQAPSDRAAVTADLFLTGRALVLLLDEFHQARLLSL